MVKLYDKTGKSFISNLDNCIECMVEEERNGLFELKMIYPTFDSAFKSLDKENIIVANANDTLRNQQFRIYYVSKQIANKVEVYARHISYDLMYDFIESINIEKQSCEYALNTIFRNSNFCKHFKGYSDIINAQNFNIEMVDCLSALAGARGSIIDTFGTGAELLRDNTNIHVLNKRGHDNSVTIEYAKNLTGFECTEDTTDLITRIYAYAKYTPQSEGEENSESKEIIVKGGYVDSRYISNYSHPYIKEIDFSEKFKEGEVPTSSKLRELALKYFEDNKCDIPKLNYKIEFIPLSKCLGYNLEDKISLCDTVTIKHKIYNISTKVKVIKVIFNVLKDRYESMELGEPRTSLNDVIGGNGENGEGAQGPPGPQGPQGPPGADGNLGDFPNSLPATPILSYKLYGFANIELSWTFENKVYYSYELYASKTKGFTPNSFDLIHAGQSSSFLFQAKPNETWHFKVCAINSYGNRTYFSNEVAVTTKKIDDFEDYFSTLAVGNLVTSMFTTDYMEAGIIKGHWIDAKQLSVTDGNGKRTLDIDSFGNVRLDVTNLNINSEAVATKNKIVSSINASPESIKIKSSKIQLEGSTTVGDSENRNIKIDRANYSIYDGTKRVGYLGFQNDEKGGHPKLTLGWNGINVDKDDYFTLHAYPTKVNAENVACSYADLAYRCINLKDWSNIKMYGDGRIKIAPLTNLEITTNCEDGVYKDEGERRLCLFDTSKSQYFNSNLQIPALRNMTSGYGLILADDHIDGKETRVRIQYDGTNRYFRPLTTAGNIALGSASYKFASLHVASGVSYSIEDSKNARTINMLDESIDSVLDSLDFNMNIHRSRSNSSQDLRLNLDVATLKKHPLSGVFLNIEEDYNEDTKEHETHTNGDMASLLHLALYELQKQKEEIKTLKEEIRKMKNK